MSDNDFESQDITQIASDCREETNKFFQKLPSDNRYCFELWCRACRDHDNKALEYIFKIWIPILRARARKHKAFYLSCQDAESFARTAVANFYHAVNGERFLEKFGSLPQVLAYLHVCLNTEILNDIRKGGNVVDLNEERGTLSIDSPNDPEEILEHIEKILPDEHNRLLFSLRFVLEMKPAEIVKRYPNMGSNERTVSMALYRIRVRLRKDPYLRHLAGINDTDDDLNESENEESSDAS